MKIKFAWVVITTIECKIRTVRAIAGDRVSPYRPGGVIMMHVRCSVGRISRVAQTWRHGLGDCLLNLLVMHVAP